MTTIKQFLFEKGVTTSPDKTMVITRDTEQFDVEDLIRSYVQLNNQERNAIYVRYKVGDTVLVKAKQSGIPLPGKVTSVEIVKSERSIIMKYTVERMDKEIIPNLPSFIVTTEDDMYQTIDQFISQCHRNHNDSMNQLRDTFEKSTANLAKS